MTVSKLNHTLVTLPSGLRFLHLHNRGSKVEYFGVAVKAGSRNDPEGYAGLAHFVEHTIFKGTARRSSHHIINRMEAVGGELNAYTTKEDTFVYSAFPSGNLSRAVELISDLVINSVFPTKELDKEREVIIEEIDSYLDSPAEAVFDDFDELLFKDRRLGHNILGNSETIAAISTNECRGFLKQYYRADNMVVFYSGPASAERVRHHVEKHFGEIAAPLDGNTYGKDCATLEATGDSIGNRHGAENNTLEKNDGNADSNGHEEKNAEMEFGSFRVRRDNDNHQAHNVMGAPLPSLYSNDRYAISLLNNIIGGPGMNSRLNVALRERRGLVYSTDSATTLYSDCGALTIYFGCSPDRVDRCVDIINRELTELVTKPLDNRRLAAAKRQYLGQITVASASAEQTVLSAARSCLYRNRFFTLDETATAIEAVTADDLIRVAHYAAPDRMSLLTLG